MSKTQKALAELEGALQPGESIVATLGATYITPRPEAAKFGPEFPKGLLALTESRLIFSGSAMIRSEQNASPLKLVTSVDLTRGIQPHFQVTLAGTMRRYIVKYKDAQPFLLKAHELLAAAQDHRPQPAVISPADELMKLADLHSKGFLTDVEFTTAKAKALG
jgi:hypothetical protein